MEIIKVYKEDNTSPDVTPTLGEREKFHPSVHNIYAQSGNHPAGFQAKLDHLYAFSVSTLGERGAEKYHGNKLAANMNFTNGYPIICRTKEKAQEIASNIYVMANHNNFKSDRCLFIKTKTLWQPVIVGKQNTLDSVERAMRETHPNAEFKRDNYAVKLIDKPKNEKRRISKKECLNMIFDDNGLKPTYKGVIKEIMKSDDRYTIGFLEKLSKDQNAFLEYKKNKDKELELDESMSKNINNKKPQAPKPK